MPLKWVRGRNATAAQEGYRPPNVHGSGGSGVDAGGDVAAGGGGGGGAGVAGIRGKAMPSAVAPGGKRAGGTAAGGSGGYHPETLEAVIDHAEARKRRFAERAARAEADRDHIVSNGGSEEDLHAAEARRTAAIAAVVALMGQLKVLRRVLDEYHAWCEEDAGIAAAAAAPAVPATVDRGTAAAMPASSAVVDATAANTTVFNNMPSVPLGGTPRRMRSRRFRDEVARRRRHHQDVPGENEIPYPSEGRGVGGDPGYGRNTPYDDGDRDFGDDPDVLDQDDEENLLRAEFENDELEEALIEERAKAAEAREDLEEAQIAADESIAENRDQTSRLNAVLSQSLLR